MCEECGQGFSRTDALKKHRGENGERCKRGLKKQSFYLDARNQVYEESQDLKYEKTNGNI